MQRMIDLDRICMGCMNPLDDPGKACPVCGLDNRLLQNAAHRIPARSVLNGRYLVGRTLGQGGFGITYIGSDLLIERRVAIKEYYPEGCVTRQATLSSQQVHPIPGAPGEFFVKGREKFISEAKVLAKFNQIPNIVNVRDYFPANGTAYIVMEYVEGETLKQRMKREGGRLSADEALPLLRPIMDALGRVHAEGLLHRDISPDNIMIRTDGTPILLDFGAAMRYADMSENSVAVNVKHGYAPEEQYRQHGELGPWSDVYAMSATIYKAVTGVTPPQSLERAVGEAAVKPPNSLGANLTPTQEKGLSLGMAVFAKARLQSMDALAKYLYSEPANVGKGEASALPDADDPRSSVSRHSGAHPEISEHSVRSARSVSTRSVPYAPEDAPRRRRKVWPWIAALAVCAAGACALLLPGLLAPEAPTATVAATLSPAPTAESTLSPAPSPSAAAAHTAYSARVADTPTPTPSPDT